MALCCPLGPNHSFPHPVGRVPRLALATPETVENKSKPMTPRPLYRWKSFWFGILVLGFLGWAWVRSMGHLDCVLWASGDGTHEIDLLQHEGEVSVFRGSNYVIHPRGFEFSTDEFSLDGAWFGRFVEVERRPNGPTVSIAHWLLILLFVVPWSGWPAWRWRKIKRLSKACTQ